MEESTLAKKPQFGISNADDLFEKFERRCNENANLVNLRATVSKQRVSDAYLAWKEDMVRNERNFLPESYSSDPDHIKCSAFLTYWLRRERPVIIMDHYDTGGMYSVTEQYKMEMEIVRGGQPDPSWTELTDEEIKGLKINNIPGDRYLNQRRRLQSYPSEYLAFEFGFSLAKAYEIQKQIELGNPNPKMSDLGVNFIDDFCYFLKFKAISPHSIYFIYRALLNSD